MPFMRVVRKQSRPLAAHPVRPAAPAWHRPASTPKAGLPAKKEKRRAGTAISFLFHVLLILFLISPAAVLTDPNLKELLLGAGGAGPSGGGGGGNLGSGAIKYVKLAPAPTPTPPKPAEVVPPKVEEPIIPPLDLPKPQATPVEVKPSAPVVGVLGGAGHDGTNGNGPGSGGGIGTGIGTGTGSGNGPGTGGGTQENYPPTMNEMFIPPLPTPSSVKGRKIVINFDVSEKGRVLDVVFSPTGDGGYDRKLKDYLMGFRFRPGHTPQGVPIRAPYSMSIEL